MSQLPTVTGSIAADPRPAPQESNAVQGGPGYARHVGAIAKRSLIKTWRTPEALIDVTLQPVVFLVMFTYIFGGAIGGSSADYLEFLLPGLLIQSIVMASVSLGQNLNSDIAKGVFDRFRSLPIGRSVPLVGAVTADIARYLTVCAATLVGGTIMGFRIETNALAAAAAIGLAVAFALSFCWISVLVGMRARTPGAVQGIMFMIVLPLSFVSSAYVNPATMPGVLQVIVAVNPITQLVNTVRGLMIGGPVATSLLATLSWMAILLVVFVPLALRAYRRRA